MKREQLIFISFSGFVNQSIASTGNNLVRLPLLKFGSINKINKMYALLEQSNERPPSAEEIAKNLT
jgi:RNA polymerase primary sigma factor